MYKEVNTSLVHYNLFSKCFTNQQTLENIQQKLKM